MSKTQLHDNDLDLNETAYFDQLIDTVKQNLSEKNESLTQQIIDNVDASIYWKDKEGRYLGCNRFVLDIAGISGYDEIIGKTDAELLWAADAPRLMAIDKHVMRHGRYAGEEVFTIFGGREITMLTIKNQLHDNEGNVVGIIGTSMDITVKKETELFKFERQQIALQEKEHFAQHARKVAHDIQSPLFALRAFIQLSKGLPEDERLLLTRAADSILDIANNLIANYHKDKDTPTFDIEPRTPILISDLLVQLLSEKKLQYRNCPIRFELNIAEEAQFVFARIQRVELRRALSNLINNAADACEGDTVDVITLQLKADADTVNIVIKDEGTGMPDDLLQRIHIKQGFTEGKEGGHGIGLQQVWDMLSTNHGIMDVQSTLGQGTTFQLTFERIAAPAWIAQAIHISATHHIVVLDDEPSIHGAWDMRIAPLLKKYPDLNVHHFMKGKEVLDFYRTLSAEDKDRVIVLSDFELLNQGSNGLEIIKEVQVKQAVLVTSHYADLGIQEAATKLGVKILPKQLASGVLICVGNDVGT